MKRRSFLKFIGMLAVAPLSFLAAPEMIKGPLPKWDSGIYYCPYIPLQITRPVMKISWTKELERDIKAAYE